MDYTLTISHLIFLSREQRYALYAGQTLQVIGVSVPVWFCKDKTNEPANEVFCEYKIIPTDFSSNITSKSKAYEIEIPLQEYNPERKESNPVVLKNILDFEDGGVEWVAFRQLSNITKNKKKVHVVQFLEIKPLEEFETSICNI